MKTRSPLRAAPHRVAGQSVDERLRDLALSRLFVPILLASFLVALALIEWARVYFPSAPRPWLMTSFAVLGVAYAVFKIWTNVPELRKLKQGRDGERAVAEVLDRLRESGYKVFHDVLGDGFNIDHVVIGPTGVYTVETKTISKPVRGTATVTIDGDQIFLNGYAQERDAVSQARSQAFWLRSMLRESTGYDFAVRPVIVYPGWFIDHHSAPRTNFWVLNPKALPAFLQNEKCVLSREAVHMAAYHLSRYTRRQLAE